MSGHHASSSPLLATLAAISLLSASPVGDERPAPPQAALSVTTSGPAVVGEGERFQYSLTYRNVGDQPANGVRVEDALPPGSTFVRASESGAFDGITVAWDVGAVAPGATGTVSFVAEAACAPQIVNEQFSIRSVETGVVPGGPPIVTTVTEGSTEPILVEATSIALTGAPLTPGGLVQHSITLTNSVAEIRNGLTMQLAAGRASVFEQVIASGGGDVTITDGQALTWKGKLGASESVTIAFTTRVADCLGPGDVSTQLNDGEPIAVSDVCGSVLGDARAPASYPLLPPLGITVAALGVAPSQPVGPGGSAVQVARDGSTVDVQLLVRNQSGAPQDVGLNLVSPMTWTAVGAPPFVAPTDPAAAWNAGMGRASWNGPLAPGAEIAITVRGVLQAGVCAPDLSRNSFIVAASTATCNVGTNLTIVPVPDAPTEAHVLGLDRRFGLWTVRPGVDLTPRELLCLWNAGTTGIDRSPDGTIWVAGQSTYTFDPSTPQLVAIDPATLAGGASGSPIDVASDASTNPPSVVFLVPRAGGSNDLLRYDPVTAQSQVIRSGVSSMKRIVVTSAGLIAGVTEHTDASGAHEVLLFDPQDVANDRRLNDPSFAQIDPMLLALDAGGTLIAATTERDPVTFAVVQTLVAVDPQTGLFTALAGPLDSLVPMPIPGFGDATVKSIATRGSDDVFVGRVGFGHLGVVHRTSPPTGEILATGQSVDDIVFVEPAGEPPPPPAPISIDVLETVSVDDDVDTMLSIMLDITEQVAVDDGVETMLSIMLDVTESVTVDDGADVIPENTPAGDDVVVQPPDGAGGVAPVVLTFEHVLAGGMSLAVSSGNGPPPPPGFGHGVPAVLYDVTTTAIFEGTVRVCLDIRGVAFNLARLRVFHFEGNAWVDRTVSIDLAQHIACAEVTSLSPFAVFQTSDVTPPELTTQFDPVAAALTVLATDSGTGPSGQPASSSLAHDKLRYDASDRAGNTVSMILSVRKTMEKEIGGGAVRRRLNLVVKTIAYNGGAPMHAPVNDLMIDWTVSADGSLEKLHQVFSVKTSDGREKLDATWDRRTGRTTIKAADSRVTLDGLVLLQVSTDTGVLRLGW